MLKIDKIVIFMWSGEKYTQKYNLKRHRFDTYSKPKILKICIKRNGTNWLLSIDLND